MDKTQNDKYGKLGTIPKGFIYRDQEKRYPWWVKSVDTITTETDDATLERKTTDQIQIGLFTPTEQDRKNAENGMAKLVGRIKDNVPGNSLKDFALHYASMTYFAGGVSMFKHNLITEMFNIHKSVSKLIHPPDELGVPRWQGSEEEASDMLEAAAIHLGACQVGFTALDPRLLEANVEIDPNVETLTPTEEGKILAPESLKYVVVLGGQVPITAQRHAPGQIGDAADRSGYENRQMAWERVVNFIKGLGYKAEMMVGMMAPTIPFALMAGLGEMGRTNRLISPIYGGAIRLETIVTDLPLALDKPIDFGLQEFCKHCKKCAKACPANAISFDDEPGWEPPGPYSIKGKKVWYDRCDRCFQWSTANGYFCGACMGACTWTKDNKTYLHDLAKMTAAKFPQHGKILALMDDLFGYGLLPKEKQGNWWKLKLPVKGIH